MDREREHTERYERGYGSGIACVVVNSKFATVHDGWSWSCLFLLGTVLLLGGCATYQPMPLTTQAVDHALTPPDMATLAAQVTTLHHPMLHPVPVDLARGLPPDAAAILAVVVNPALRGERDRRALASAQLLQAGVLPNPVLSVGSDIVTGGHTAGTFPGYSGRLSWDVTALHTHSTHTAAARAASEAVQLDRIGKCIFPIPKALIHQG